MHPTDLLPTTALVALSIFAVKEIAELIRRRNSDKRKLKAIKTTIAEELQRNAFCRLRLTEIIKNILSYEEDDEVIWTFDRDPEGRVHVSMRYPDETIALGSWLPRTSTSTYQKVFLDLAGLDEKSFTTISEAYDRVSDMDHVRSSLLDQIGPRAKNLPDLRDFADWAKEELNQIKIGMTSAYEHCTGKKDIPIKLR